MSDNVQQINNKTGGLVANHLSKSYKKRPVLKNINLNVQQGEAVALLGPNGAGKTTSFYIMTGLIAPNSGHITLDGHDITKLPMYRRARLGIGYLPQESSIFRGLNVEKNILAILESQPISNRALASRPKFMLLDEPLAGIDPIAVGDIRTLIKYLKTKEIGVLITDHNVRDCLDIVDRAYILHDGNVLMEGTPEEIISNDDVRRVYLGENFI